MLVTGSLECRRESAPGVASPRCAPHPALSFREIPAWWVGSETPHAFVAQFGRAVVSKTTGCRFKSCRACEARHTCCHGLMAEFGRRARFRFSYCYAVWEFESPWGYEWVHPTTEGRQLL